MDKAEHDLKKCGDQGGCYPRPITLSEIFLTLQMTRKPNPIIVLLFFQNNSEITNKLNLHAYPDVKFQSSFDFSLKVKDIEEI